MATRKRKCTGGLDPISLGLKLLKVVETPQQRQARLERNRTRNAEARAAETPGGQTMNVVYPKALQKDLNVINVTVCMRIGETE
jgi:hypothetical protein